LAKKQKNNKEIEKMHKDYKIMLDEGKNFNVLLKIDCSRI
jgi:hypothetical protein